MKEVLKRQSFPIVFMVIIVISEVISVISERNFDDHTSVKIASSNLSRRDISDYNVLVKSFEDTLASIDAQDITIKFTDILRQHTNDKLDQISTFKKDFGNVSTVVKVYEILNNLSALNNDTKNQKDNIIDRSISNSGFDSLSSNSYVLLKLAYDDFYSTDLTTVSTLVEYFNEYPDDSQIDNLHTNNTMSVNYMNNAQQNRNSEKQNTNNITEEVLNKMKAVQEYFLEEAKNIQNILKNSTSKNDSTQNVTKLFDRIKEMQLGNKSIIFTQKNKTNDTKDMIQHKTLNLIKNANLPRELIFDKNSADREKEKNIIKIVNGIQNVQRNLENEIQSSNEKKYSFNGPNNNISMLGFLNIKEKSEPKLQLNLLNRSESSITDKFVTEHPKVIKNNNSSSAKVVNEAAKQNNTTEITIKSEETVNKSKLPAKACNDTDNRYKVIELKGVEDSFYYNDQNDTDDNDTEYINNLIDYVELYKNINLEDVPYELPNVTEKLSVVPLGKDKTNVSPINKSCRHDSGLHELSEIAYPWIATIFIKETPANRFKYSCDGAIMSNRSVLTAANCLRNLSLTTSAEDVLIITGKRNQNDMTNNELYKVKKIKYHEENAKNKNNENDLAILISEEPFRITDYIVEVACLLDEEHKQEEVIDAISSGWIIAGDLVPISFNVSNSNTGCLEKHELEAPTVFCGVYGDEVDTCPSFGGLYFVKLKSNSWYLKGISSEVMTSSRFCVNRNLRFTDLSKYRDWLKNKIE